MNTYEKGMLAPDSLNGKTIAITGGGSGLGLSMAAYFLALGAQVSICGRKEDTLKAASAELQSRTGKRVFYYPCDVRQYEAVETFREKTIEALGPVNGLVNNAAGNFLSPTERLSHRAFDSVVDIVLKGSYNNSLSFGKYWIDQKIAGSTLNIVTTYAWTGSAYVVPSACGKAGVLALTRSLGVEWAKYGIRTNAIAPGPFPTPGAWDRLFPQEFMQQVDIPSKIPVGRVGIHQELANLAAYLMSDFSAFIQGEVITIDGGEWLKNGGEFSWVGDMIPPEMWDMVEALIRGKSGKS